MTRQDQTQVEARDLFLGALKESLVGPQEEREALSEMPIDRYLYGFLWPASMGAVQILKPEEEASYKEVLDGEDTESDSNENLPTNLINRQSCIGISFAVPLNSKDIEAEISFARYELASNKQDGRQWQRHPVVITKCFHPNTSNQSFDISEGLTLDITSIKTDEAITCTVSLVNRAKVSSDVDYDHLCELIVFQPRIALRSIDSQGFQQRSIQLQLGSEESKMYEVLYQSMRPVCFGHGTSTGQSHDFKKIWTEFIPSYETPNVDKTCSRYFGDLPTETFSAACLGEAKPNDITSWLDGFIRCYIGWIDHKSSELSDFPAEWREVISPNLEKCRVAAGRMQSSVLEMSRNEEYLDAFQMANKAISLQNKWKSPHSDFQWRPFQLGFFLLVIESFISDEQASRNTADLLWFPTGGGKTEAYLGIIAFLLFSSSYSSAGVRDPGTQVLIRYTLRLLTRQQFERAAALVMASEYIRKKSRRTHAESKQFSIGLWIGNSSTPNTREDARQRLMHTDIQQSDPRQLLECPCCKSSLAWSYEHSAPVRPVCTNISCEIAGPMGIYTVDEDIYRERPSIILGTSDKFVQMTRNDKTSQLFESSTGVRPELILQDELHLISGPLGSVAGLFESAVDMICSRHRKAKVIGSTATIKNADTQIRSLFNRDSLQFPPPGIDFRDSCFALEDKGSPGRLYIGTSSVGRSPKYALASVTGSTFFHANRLADIYSQDDGRLKRQTDSFTTIIAYFNSLKELGGAAVLFQDDVTDRLTTLSEIYDCRPIRVENQRELTSTRTQDELQEILRLLENRRESGDHIDICLSTNMISVGVDVSRLGLMIVNGQPKSKSEYIQATSRVGRRDPGIVLTLYNDSKVRDKSAYEAFFSLHSNIYKDVEVTSVTPYSPQCIDKMLPTAFVAACRHLSPAALQGPMIEAFQDTADYVENEFMVRCQRISPENTDYLKNAIMDLRATWMDGAPTCYVLNQRRPNGIALFTPAEDAATMNPNEYLFPLLSSVRSVEAQCNVIPRTPSRRRS